MPTRLRDRRRRLVWLGFDPRLALGPQIDIAARKAGIGCGQRQLGVQVVPLRGQLAAFDSGGTGTDRFRILEEANSRRGFRHFHPEGNAPGAVHHRGVPIPIEIARQQ